MFWAVVVVKWSACPPSTPTIRVRIPLKSTIFCKIVVEKNNNKQKKRNGLANLKNLLPSSVTLLKRVKIFHFSTEHCFDNFWLTFSVDIGQLFYFNLRTGHPGNDHTAPACRGPEAINLKLNDALSLIKLLVSNN